MTRKLTYFFIISLFIILLFNCTESITDGSGNNKTIEITGSILWKYKTDNVIRSKAVYNADTVYFTSSDGNLYALNSETGEEIWIYETNNTLLSSPVLNTSTLYFTGLNGVFYAINISTGTLEWSLSISEQDINDSWDYYLSTPLIDGNTAYFGIGNNLFNAVDLVNKEQKWIFNTLGDVHTEAVISNSIVYFGDFSGNLYAVNAETGIEEWNYNTGGAIMSSPAVSNNIVCFGSRSCRVYALNALNGDLLWNYSHGSSWVAASPIIYNDVVYIGSSDALFFQAININSGEEIWRVSSLYNVFGKADISSNKIFFGSGDAYNTPGSGYLFSVDLTSYKRNALLKSGNIFSTPIIENDIIYIGADDKYFYAVQQF